MKKLLLLMLMVLPVVAIAADPVKIDGIMYYIQSKNNTAEVAQKSSGYEGCVVIPASVTYDGVTYPVTTIGECAFSTSSSVTSVTIPNTVTTIRLSAFRG